MVYIDFKVDDVEYRLIRSRHYRPRNEPIHDLDALVIETGEIKDTDVKRVLFDKSELDNYIGDIISSSMPVYSVDTRKVKGDFTGLGTLNILGSIVRPALAAGILYTLGLNPIIALSIGYLPEMILETSLFSLLSSKKYSNDCAKFNSFISLIQQSPANELRNAVSAKKIKYGVVPRLKEKFPEKQDLKIGLLYGAFHTGIQECLENDKRTEFTLNFHKRTTIPLYFRKEINDIYEYDIEWWNKATFEKFTYDVFS